MTAISERGNLDYLSGLLLSSVDDTHLGIITVDVVFFT